MGYIIIVIGLILVVWGIIIVRKPNTADKVETVNKQVNDLKIISETNSIDTVIEKAQTRKIEIKETKTEKSKEDIDAENKAKGDAFESFVVKHFEKKYFTLQEWRGDKYVDGNYPVSSHFPDLEVNFKYPKQNINESFAIECKWRKNYYKNAIEWAHDYQIKNYREYTEKLNIPVYVVIGVGGEPSMPNEVFIIPLSKLKSNTINQNELKAYKRKTVDENFYWKFKDNILE